MGMSSGDFYSVVQRGRCPLLSLSTEIYRNRGQIKLNNKKEPVVSGFFDSIHNNIVAPDHLFTGIVKCLLECCINLLPILKSAADCSFL